MKLERLIYNGLTINENKLNFNVLRRGFLYGDGIFETLIARNSKIFRYDEHWERLKKGAEICNFELPEKMMVKKWIENEIGKFKWEKCYIRVNIWRKKPFSFNPKLEKKTDCLIIIKKFQPYPEKFYKNGIKCILNQKIRKNEKSFLSQIKSFNYLENIVLKIESEKQTYDDVIILNTKGYIVGSSVSNIFFIKNGKVYTPSLKCGCLEGITRKVIFEICHREKIKIKEGFFKIDFLKKCEEVFLTNTLMEIMPVKEIKGLFKNRKFYLTKILMEKYKEIFEKETE